MDNTTSFTLTKVAPWTDGFWFYSITDPLEKDAIVILNPATVNWQAPLLARSRKSLDEHIQYIQENQITKAVIVAENIEFIRQCPSLEYLWIIPAWEAKTFDYSPLYDLPNLHWLDCQMVYGPRDNQIAHMDFSRLSAIQTLHIRGKKGNQNLNKLRGLTNVSFSEGQPASKDLSDSLIMDDLMKLDICQSKLRSLHGIENAQKLKTMVLSYNRSLEDISALSALRDTLTVLSIESCGKVRDFSVLYDLHNLEHLNLNGSNELPNLEFLRGMPNLKTFVFSMNVLDGDLTLCKTIPYASCNNKRHYNLKDKDLPKQLPTP